ncbi:MAG TPA: aminotransferase class I and II, partial [Rubrivivax sp.]|nr:aminotransferase class I and II [Rubrivivax sp.]
MRTVAATRYLTPLREGGSLPAIVEADDDGLYVLKFRGAGQGPKALIAELVAGEIARALGLPVPEIVFMQLDTELARTEPDPEIQDLIRASAGLNVGLDYLSGAVNFDPAADVVTPDFASRLVWFDTLVSNVDRTARNTNLLMWHRQPWLIDHGASLTFHHAWNGSVAYPGKPFAPIAEHVLLPRASQLAEADTALAPRLSGEVLQGILNGVPD